MISKETLQRYVRHSKLKEGTGAPMSKVLIRLFDTDIQYLRQTVDEGDFNAAIRAIINITTERGK